MFAITYDLDQILITSLCKISTKITAVHSQYLEPPRNVLPKMKKLYVIIMDMRSNSSLYLISKFILTRLSKKGIWKRQLLEIETY